MGKKVKFSDNNKVRYYELSDSERDMKKNHLKSINKNVIYNEIQIVMENIICIDLDDEKPDCFFNKFYIWLKKLIF